MAVENWVEVIDPAPDVEVAFVVVACVMVTIVVESIAAVVVILVVVGTVM